MTYIQQQQTKEITMKNLSKMILLLLSMFQSNLAFGQNSVLSCHLKPDLGSEVKITVTETAGDLFRGVGSGTVHVEPISLSNHEIVEFAVKSYYHKFYSINIFSAESNINQSKLFSLKAHNNSHFNKNQSGLIFTIQYSGNEYESSCFFKDYQQ